MEDKQLFKGTFTNGSYELDIRSNNVTGVISYHDALELDLVIKSKAGLEILKTLIPGTIDDQIITLIEAALGL